MMNVYSTVYHFCDTGSLVEPFHRVDRIEMANLAKKRLGSVSFDLLPQRCVLSASPTFIKIENIMQ